MSTFTLKGGDTTRRYNFPFNGKQFIGNTNTNEVHNLDNEQTSCNINLIKVEHVKTFSPDTYSEAKRMRFDNCAHCIGNSRS